MLEAYLISGLPSYRCVWCYLLPWSR